MTCNKKQDYYLLQMFLLKALILIMCMEWHSSICISAPRYDFFTRQPRLCFLQPVNAARGQRNCFKYMWQT